MYLKKEEHMSVSEVACNFRYENKEGEIINPEIEPSVRGGFYGRVEGLCKKPKKVAKLVADVAEAVKIVGCNAGKLGEYSHIAKMLSPFDFILNTPTLINSERKDVKFYGDWLKGACDTYQVVAYMSSSVALEHFTAAAGSLKHVTALVQDLNSLYKMRDTCKLSEDFSKLLGTVCDVLFRIVALELYLFHAHLNMAVMFMGLAVQLYDALGVDSKDVMIDQGLINKCTVRVSGQS
jgi:hypothetical protein